MAVIIKIPRDLRRFSDGNIYIHTIPGPFSEILKDIKNSYPLLFEKIATDQGKIKGYILIIRESKNNKDLVSEDSLVEDFQKLRILLAVSGG